MTADIEAAQLGLGEANRKFRAAKAEFLRACEARFAPGATDADVAAYRAALAAYRAADRALDEAYRGMTATANVAAAIAAAGEIK